MFDENFHKRFLPEQFDAKLGRSNKHLAKKKKVVKDHPPFLELFTAIFSILLILFEPPISPKIKPAPLLVRPVLAYP